MRRMISYKKWKELNKEVARIDKKIDDFKAQFLDVVVAESQTLKDFIVPKLSLAEAKAVLEGLLAGKHVRIVQTKHIYQVISCDNKDQDPGLQIFGIAIQSVGLMRVTLTSQDIVSYSFNTFFD